MKADAVVIGAGIAGTSIAYFLSKRGKKVVLADRGLIGAEASGRNAGGVRQQGRHLPEIAMAAKAVDTWKGLDKELGRPTGYRQVGHAFLAEDDGDMEHLRRQQESERPTGLHTELLGPAELRELMPGLSHHVIGGKFCPTDGMAEPGAAPVALADASEEAGATILTHHPVTAIGTSDNKVEYVQAGDVRIETPVVVNAAGPWAPRIAELVNVYLPVYPSRLSIIQVAPTKKLAHCFVQTAKSDFSASQPLDNSMRLGHGANRTDTARFTYDKAFDRQASLRVADRARMIFPELADAKATWAWMGIREMTPDNMPIIGPALGGPEGFMICAGLSGHGFCLGPVLGRFMAEWIVDGQPSMNLDAFRFSRFMRMDGPLTVPKVLIEQTG